MYTGTIHFLSSRESRRAKYRYSNGLRDSVLGYNLPSPVLSHSDGYKELNCLAIVMELRFLYLKKYRVVRITLQSQYRNTERFIDTLKIPTNDDKILHKLV